MLKYAGIGSRETPEIFLELFTDIGSELQKDNILLRSGGAKGADNAFAKRCKLKEIFRPEHATEAAIEYISNFHPAWHRCNDYVRELHGRNAQIILGQDLDDPVDFVICWTKGGKIIGGTATGIKVAEANNIPVFNYGSCNTTEDIISMCTEINNYINKLMED